MDFVRLGSTGLKVSRLCLGTMTYSTPTGVRGFSTRLGVTSAQVALAWMLAQSDVTAPIVDASKISHLDEAVAALHITLSAEDRAFLEAPYQPHRVLGFKD